MLIDAMCALSLPPIDIVLPSYSSKDRQTDNNIVSLNM